MENKVYNSYSGLPITIVNKHFCKIKDLNNNLYDRTRVLPITIVNRTLQKIKDIQQNQRTSHHYCQQKLSQDERSKEQPIRQNQSTAHHYYQQNISEDQRSKAFVCSLGIPALPEALVVTIFRRTTLIPSVRGTGVGPGAECKANHDKEPQFSFSALRDTRQLSHRTRVLR